MWYVCRCLKSMDMKKKKINCWSWLCNCYWCVSWWEEIRWIQEGFRLKINNVLISKIKTNMKLLQAGLVYIMSESHLRSLLIGKNNFLVIELIHLLKSVRTYRCLLWELYKDEMTLQISPGSFFYASVKISCFSQVSLTRRNLLQSNRLYQSFSINFLEWKFTDWRKLTLFKSLRFRNKIKPSGWHRVMKQRPRRNWDTKWSPKVSSTLIFFNSLIVSSH